MVCMGVGGGVNCIESKNFMTLMQRVYMQLNGYMISSLYGSVILNITAPRQIIREQSGRTGADPAFK